MRLHFLGEPCSSSANPTPASVWPAASKKFQMDWVRSPSKRTKVVTMGAPQKFRSLDTFSFWFFSKSISGFTDIQIWKSLIASEFMDHKATAFSFCSLFVSGENDLVLRRLLSSFVVGRGIASNWERSWKSSGVGEKEEKVKDWRDGLWRGVAWGFSCCVCDSGVDWGWFEGCSCWGGVLGQFF